MGYKKLFRVPLITNTALSAYIRGVSEKYPTCVYQECWLDLPVLLIDVARDMYTFL